MPQDQQQSTQGESECSSTSKSRNAWKGQSGKNAAQQGGTAGRCRCSGQSLVDESGKEYKLVAFTSTSCKQCQQTQKHNSHGSTEDPTNLDLQGQAQRLRLKKNFLKLAGLGKK